MINVMNQPTRKNNYWNLPAKQRETLTKYIKLKTELQCYMGYNSIYKMTNGQILNEKKIKTLDN